MSRISPKQTSRAKPKRQKGRSIYFEQTSLMKQSLNTPMNKGVTLIPIHYFKQYGLILIHDFLNIELV